ncbi:hypothetical protein WN51_11136 [Melipona quadrifasciata]|uniref:Uncharacterized protein n=1 Tax=Melipona quadrifasciata TaxID=166423 RepID=A0A0M9A6F4_9HYME|nr:hypothetical protein WN51_11136 [Melipona quadrifasciata]
MLASWARHAKLMNKNVTKCESTLQSAHGITELDNVVLHNTPLWYYPDISTPSSRVLKFNKIDLKPNRGRYSREELRFSHSPEVERSIRASFIVSSHVSSVCTIGCVFLESGGSTIDSGYTLARTSEDEIGSGCPGYQVESSSTVYLPVYSLPNMKTYGETLRFSSFSMKDPEDDGFEDISQRLHLWDLNLQWRETLAKHRRPPPSPSPPSPLSPPSQNPILHSSTLIINLLYISHTCNDKVNNKDYGQQNTVIAEWIMIGDVAIFPEELRCVDYKKTMRVRVMARRILSKQNASQREIMCELRLALSSEDSEDLSEQLNKLCDLQASRGELSSFEIYVCFEGNFTLYTMNRLLYKK